MKNLIPHLIQEKYLKNKTSGWIFGSVVSIDLKGFTKMTEDLMKDGYYGAETLSEIINKVFEPVIDIIYKKGGFVTAFIGDAITAVFPNEYAFNAESASKDILKKFSKISSISIENYKFNLNIRIGISYGRVIWKIVNVPERSVYFFKGKTVDLAADAQQKAVPGKIKIDRSYKIENGKPNNKKAVIENISEEVLKDFVPDNVLEMKTLGEFRDIVSIFITFNEISTDLILLSKFLCSESVKYKGYLNKIDFGDKGGIALVVFGAPIKVEKYAEHALSFAIELEKRFPFIKIGIAKGITYCGFVGSAKRAEYTVLGDTVNLSARLINVTPKGKIRVDENMAKYNYSGFEFKTEGKYKFKGFSKQLAVFSPEVRSHKKHLDVESVFVGREKEMQVLKDFIEPIFKNRFAGYIQINGNAGVGKSRLVSALKDNLGKKKFKWFFISCDNIVNKSFQPLISFLNQYIQLIESLDIYEKTKIFKEHLGELKKISRSIKDNLKKIEFFLGKLLGLNVNDKTFEKLPSQDIYENTLFAFKHYMLSYCTKYPVILEIDDIYKADEQTLDVIKVLSRSEENIPFCIIGSSRYLDNGEKFVPGLDDVDEFSIELKTLTRSSARAIIEFLLSVKISDKLFNTIWEKSTGNPFYTEQLTLFLKESKFLYLEEGTMTIDPKEYAIPEKISSVIISRIDRLSSELRTSIKTASVLGKEFSAMVLSKMLKSEDIDSHLKLIEKEAFWSNITEMLYIFKHALIRDSVYQMQLKKTLKVLHKLAAETIKSVHKKGIEKYYADIAYHYEKSGDNKNTIDYLYKAALYANEKYFLKESINHYNKLLKFETDKTNIADIKCTLADMLYTLGKWDESKALYKEAEVLAKKLKNIRLMIRAKSGIAEIVFEKGDPVKAMEIFKKLNLQAKNNKLYRLQADILINMGVINRISSKFDEALKCYNSVIKLDKFNKDDRLMCGVYDNLGVVYLNNSELGKAKENFNKSKEIAKRTNNIVGLMHARSNEGIIYYRQGNTKEAEKIYLEALKVAEDIGHLRHKSTILGHLASISYYNTDYNQALDYLNEGYDIANDLGDKASKCYLLSSIGVLNRRLGNNKKSFESFEIQKKLAKELNNHEQYAMSIGNIAFMHSLLGNFKKSNKMYEESNILTKKVNDRYSLGHNYISMGENFRHLKDHKKSIEYYKNGLVIAEEFDAKFLLVSSYYYFGEVYFDVNDHKNAKIYFSKALNLAKELERDDYIFDSKLMLIFIDKKMKDKEKALLELRPDKLGENKKANLNRILFLTTGMKKYKTAAVKIYRDLFDKFGYYEYKVALDQLK
ncbi:MAG: tetratricopeptide repeat protein [Candidatus Delongbacteria bacterium]|nr:tetratricopeptide repeat protein [Candidatus Delongbacteria bacterium]